MIPASLLRKALFVSALSHIAFFGVFGFSFGPKPVPLEYARGFFWGEILQQYELPIQRTVSLSKARELPVHYSKAVFLQGPEKEHFSGPSPYVKPLMRTAFLNEKLNFTPEPAAPDFLMHKAQQPVMLYPNLPDTFPLYFKDRQTAHIELSFNIIPRGRLMAVEVRRKISSGNLEADLLSIRYMSHYLFIQQASFPANEWQTVKIDLSTKNN